MPVLGPIQVLAASVGAPTHVGQIIATTTKNNADTAVPFSITSGAVVLLQASAACHVRPVASSTGTVTTANGVKLAADEKVTISMGGAYTHLAVVGAATVVVWELT